MKTNKTYSSAIQEQFVKRHKKQHHLITFFRFFIFFLFISIWELTARTGKLDVFFFSSPSIILQTFYEMMIRQQLFSHIWNTLYETLISFLVIMLISVLMATILWSFPFLSKVLEPYFIILNSLPKSALAPLFIVWLGTGSKTIIIAGISVAVFGSIINLYAEFLQTDSNKLLLIRVLGGSKKDELLRVVLPSSLSVILNIAKVNIGLSLVGVIIGEFLAAKKGLGYLIIYGSQIFDLNMVITSILILCLLALLFYKIIQTLEHKYKKAKDI